MSHLLDKKKSRILLYNTLFYQLHADYAGNPIDWRKDAEGRQFSAELLWQKYSRMLEYTHVQFMESDVEWIDRHKIVALTQDVILRELPLAYTDCKVNTDDEIVRLNADFAFTFGIQFICRMNEKHYPKEKFVNPANHFGTDTFMYPFKYTEEGKDFICAHKTYLKAKRRSAFPQFAISQIWAALEQWGLTYARLQATWPQEKKPLARVNG